jgi:hypothetical protein
LHSQCGVVSLIHVDVSWWVSLDLIFSQNKTDGVRGSPGHA